MKQRSLTYNRYHRQIILKGFGEAGQEKLQQAAVLVIGAGGLGCAVLQYLSAAGVGTLGIADDDVVTLHNLHRQVLYHTRDVGLKKVEVAYKRLFQMNPDLQIDTFPICISNENALDIICRYDIIVDATDNFVSRYIINDACVLSGKPFIYAGITEFEGQISVFNYPTAEQPVPVNYRDLFPNPSLPGSVLNCGQAGVLGILPGIIGIMQATEVIKLLTGIGDPLINKLSTYNALKNSCDTFALSVRPGTTAAMPVDAVSFRQRDYHSFCNGGNIEVEEIDGSRFKELLETPAVSFIDVRENGEQPEAGFPHLKIPLSQIRKTKPVIESDMAVIFCQSGKRSRVAAGIIADGMDRNKKLFSLKGGIAQWNQEKNEQ